MNLNLSHPKVEEQLEWDLRDALRSEPSRDFSHSGLAQPAGRPVPGDAASRLASARRPLDLA